MRTRIGFALKRKFSTLQLLNPGAAAKAAWRCRQGGRRRKRLRLAERRDRGGTGLSLNGADDERQPSVRRSAYLALVPWWVDVTSGWSAFGFAARSAKSSQASTITRRRFLSTGLFVLWARSSNDAADRRYSVILLMGFPQPVKTRFALQPDRRKPCSPTKANFH
jgi:hypothetical protein